MPSSNEHILRSYDDELSRLKGELGRMGQIAVAQIEGAMDVLERRDSRAAERVILNDEAIDLLEASVSHDVLLLLARRQPMARDLREVMAALRIAADIERIGDYAANVAKRTIALNLSAPIPPAANLPTLAETAIELVRDVLIAYRESDADLARQVWERDVELDALYTSLFRELLTYMMEDSRNITPATHVLFMAKNIERIGDHATNIAENVWFLVTGTPLEEPRKKGDLTATGAVDPERPRKD
ncbi:MAG: phosphate signaling complex protein PhoU [Metallibacterium scheffleri]|jgi:phosphate transport system protein|uniref:phosphate signaling complex protein PhoU n=1 Tax=Metallibacterium scheffleri TaxID=993689 RepID=UPI0026F3510E|nr:phosphate signaling complex protein PhoU [Metallibacterium scheffleri]MCK9367080.1 phosphate signaling complex protein PhoU [Metallibacterium scheffleri]